ncbi:hypothetical protein L2E82_17455 [Cichorium intybus]|uniref:Uncharacterized protein n=1 Tax=Cichorium intybus TaxID=13427 RepID=A0ACB9F965_CICIN|nr:hypothetical protein L2E82_17455 [Cichorium intybus]
MIPIMRWVSYSIPVESLSNFSHVASGPSGYFDDIGGKLTGDVDVAIRSSAPAAGDPPSSLEMKVTTATFPRIRSTVRRSATVTGNDGQHSSLLHYPLRRAEIHHRYYKRRSPPPPSPPAFLYYFAMRTYNMAFINRAGPELLYDISFGGGRDRNPEMTKMGYGFIFTTSLLYLLHSTQITNFHPLHFIDQLPSGI